MPTFTFRIARPSATFRTLSTWFWANLGGTAWLVLSFPHDTAADLVAPLLIALTVAVLTLLVAPVTLPLFALAQRCPASWQRVGGALGAVVLAFGLANAAFVQLLPVGSAAETVRWSLPYLGTAALAVACMFRAQAVRVLAPQARLRRSGTALLESWRPRVRRMARPPHPALLTSW